MTIEELIERELKRSAKDTARILKKAIQIGREVGKVFFDEFSRELLNSEVEKRTGKKPKQKEDEDDE